MPGADAAAVAATRARSAEHLALGRARAARDEDVLIIGSGLTITTCATSAAGGDIEGLRRLARTGGGGGAPADRAKQLSNGPLPARASHPRRHLIPLMVYVGAAGVEQGDRVYHEDAPLGRLVVWGYRFGTAANG